MGMLDDLLDMLDDAAERGARRGITLDELGGEEDMDTTTFTIHMVNIRGTHFVTLTLKGEGVKINGEPIADPIDAAPLIVRRNDAMMIFHKYGQKITQHAHEIKHSLEGVTPEVLELLAQ